MDWIKKYQSGKPLWQEGLQVVNEEYYKNKYKDYLKSQSNKGRQSVVNTTTDFAKNYLEPVTKAAGSITPAGPAIGLVDAYNSYKQGDTTGAIIGAGMEALPYGLKYGWKGVKQIPFEKINFSKRSIPEAHELSFDLDAILKKAKAELKAEEAARKPGDIINELRKEYEPVIKAKQEGVDWFNNWTNHPEFIQRTKGLNIKPISRDKNITEKLNLRSKFNLLLDSPFSSKKQGKFLYEELEKRPKEIFMRKKVSQPKLEDTLFNSKFEEVHGLSDAHGNVRVNANKSDPRQVTMATIHELSHNKFFNKFPDVSEYFKPNKAIPDQFVDKIFSYEGSVKASEIKKVRDKIKYLTNNTETYARINEVRKNYGIEPGQFINTENALELHRAGELGFTDVDPKWFTQMKSPLDLKKMLNTFPALGGLTILNNQLSE